MNGTTQPVAPVWFMFVNMLLLAWNLMGLAVFAVSVTFFGNREALEEMGLEEQQIDLMLSTPLWVQIAFGAAVVFGVLGCIALVARKKLAIPLLVISLLGVLAQNTFTYLLSDTVEIMGVGLSPLVIAIAIAVIPWAVVSAKRGWLK